MNCKSSCACFKKPMRIEEYRELVKRKNIKNKEVYLSQKSRKRRR